jgi:hypothetical protein
VTDSRYGISGSNRPSLDLWLKLDCRTATQDYQRDENCDNSPAHNSLRSIWA